VFVEGDDIFAMNSIMFLITSLIISRFWVQNLRIIRFEQGIGLF